MIFQQILFSFTLIQGSIPYAFSHEVLPTLYNPQGSLGKCGDVLKEFPVKSVIICGASCSAIGENSCRGFSIGKIDSADSLRLCVLHSSYDSPDGNQDFVCYQGDEIQRPSTNTNPTSAPTAPTSNSPSNTGSFGTSSGQASGQGYSSLESSSTSPATFLPTVSYGNTYELSDALHTHGGCPSNNVAIGMIQFYYSFWDQPSQLVCIPSTLPFDPPQTQSSAQFDCSPDNSIYVGFTDGNGPCGQLQLHSLLDDPNKCEVRTTADNDIPDILAGISQENWNVFIFCVESKPLLVELQWESLVLDHIKCCEV